MSKVIMSFLHNDLPTYEGLSVKDIKKRTIKLLKTNRIKEFDKEEMIYTIRNLQGKNKLLTYLWNCLLKYEGDGVT